MLGAKVICSDCRPGARCKKCYAREYKQRPEMRRKRLEYQRAYRAGERLGRTNRSAARPCTRCRVVCPPDAFYAERAVCKACISEENIRRRRTPEQKALRQTAEYKAKERDKNKARWSDLDYRRKAKEHSLRSHYGITGEDWARMYNAQCRQCRLCAARLDGGKGTHVDHCHVTGRVRGLLCSGCNLSVGHWDKWKDRATEVLQYLSLSR